MLQVDKNAKPPVCKIMDFHKQMYRRQEREKERAKSRVQYAVKVACEISLIAFGWN